MTASVEEKVLSDVSAAEPAAPTGKPAPKAEPEPPVVEEYASFDDLINKPPRERDVTITSGTKTLKLHIRAIGTDAYDQLVASCPPTAKDTERGQIFDQKSFQPKLVSACVTRPRMDLDRAARLMADPNWSGGEWGGLYAACVEICQTGINVPFSGAA